MGTSFFNFYKAKVASEQKNRKFQTFKEDFFKNIQILDENDVKETFELVQKQIELNEAQSALIQDLRESNDEPVQLSLFEILQNKLHQPLTSAEYRKIMNKEAELRALKSKTYDQKAPVFLLFVGAFFMSPKDRETLLGDMEEKYNFAVQKFGTSRAKKLLARDIFESALPLIKTIIRGASISALKTVGLYKLFKLFF